MLTVAELSSALADRISERAPIPRPDPAESTEPMLAYRREMVVEQELSHEPLVRPDLEGIATFSYYACDDGQNPPYYRRLAGSLAHVWLRRGVVDRLQVVNQALRRFNLELLVLDGYRTLACQHELWTRFITLGREMFPDYGEDELRAYALGNRPLPAEIDRADRTTWPTHSTGGSVDLTLRTLAGAPVYMGGVFDDPGWISDTAAYEVPAWHLRDAGDAVSGSYLEARGKRRLLYWAMTLAGFTNVPNEWWHYDWGNQLWSFRMRKADPAFAQQAWYGYIDPPDDPHLPDRRS